MTTFLSPPPAIEQPVVVTNDGGGIIEDFLAKAQTYNLQGRRVEIRGSCRSACIIAFAVKNVCVGPRAEVKAHMPYNLYGGQVRPDYVNKMLGSIPANMREYLEPRLTVDYSPQATLNYKQLRSFGIPACDSKVTASDEAPKPIYVKPIGKPTIKIWNPLDAITRFFR